MKKIFKVDAALYLLGFLTAATGFIFHIVGHGGSHRAWELWAWAHTLIATMLTVMIIQHLLTHKAWIRGLGDKVLRRKRRITLFLSAIALTVIASGVALLAIAGANTPVGLLHYRLGIVFAIFSFGHAARRYPIFKKAIKRK